MTNPNAIARASTNTSAPLHVRRASPASCCECLRTLFAPLRVRPWIRRPVCLRPRSVSMSLHHEVADLEQAWSRSRVSYQTDQGAACHRSVLGVDCAAQTPHQLQERKFSDDHRSARSAAQRPPGQCSRRRSARRFAASAPASARRQRPTATPAARLPPAVPARLGDTYAGSRRSR